MSAVGRPRVARAYRGWRVTVRLVDDDDHVRPFTSFHPSWSDALEHALELATLGA